MDDAEFSKRLEGRRPVNFDWATGERIKNEYLIVQDSKRVAQYNGDKMLWAYFYGVEQGLRTILELIYGIPTPDRGPEIRKNLDDMKEF